jgi:chromosome segregation ATPase
LSDEKTSSSTIIRDLNNAISSRDAQMRELKLKIHQIEVNLNDKEDQLKNVCSLKDRIETESKMQIADLVEQINILEEVKHKEVGDMSEKLSTIESQLSIFQSESQMSRDSEKIQRDLLSRIKDLEMSETELQITNQNLKRQIEEFQSNNTASVPKIEGNPGEQDLVEHIEFLNSIIADMHKKNLKLTKQIQSLEVGTSKSAHTSFTG